MIDSVMGIFGKSKVDPKTQVRELSRKMRNEMHGLQRQINAIDREEEKVKREIKASAKKGDIEACKVLAKSVVESRKAKNKLYTTSTQINSVINGMQHQLATIRMAGTIQQSTEVMKTMQQLMKVPQVMGIMREMSKEMMKAGLIEEMIEDTMSALEPDELEELAQEEVDRVLWEVTAGELGKAAAVPVSAFEKEKETKRRDIITADAYLEQMSSKS